jgi:hypothetical protein
VPEPSLRAAWQSLFLVVPVVPTTFASVERLLGRLGREALGWLLIDEAGQAASQAAAGAIWRARRVVPVGDPLQLEPVVTVLHTTQRALHDYHDVTDTWLPGRTSVQVLTDLVITIDTSLPGPDDTDVWFGAPLRVHRRCDEPMFDVVNTVVYDGLMIPGRPPREHPLTVVESAWIDVTATRTATGSLTRATPPSESSPTSAARGADPASIMAISPFRDTARNLRRALAGPTLSSKAAPYTRHRARKADVVLLVLGGNPAKPRAREWAVSQPVQPGRVPY